MIPWQLRETTSNRNLGPHTSVVTLGESQARVLKAMQEVYA